MILNERKEVGLSVLLLLLGGMVIICWGIEYRDFKQSAKKYYLGAFTYKKQNLELLSEKKKSFTCAQIYILEYIKWEIVQCSVE